MKLDCTGMTVVDNYTVKNEIFNRLPFTKVLLEVASTVIYRDGDTAYLIKDRLNSNPLQKCLGLDYVIVGKLTRDIIQQITRNGATIYEIEQYVRENFTRINLCIDAGYLNPAQKVKNYILEELDETGADGVEFTNIQNTHTFSTHTREEVLLMTCFPRSNRRYYKDIHGVRRYFVYGKPYVLKGNEDINEEELTWKNVFNTKYLGFQDFSSCSETAKENGYKFICFNHMVYRLDKDVAMALAYVCDSNHIK